MWRLPSANSPSGGRVVIQQLFFLSHKLLTCPPVWALSLPLCGRDLWWSPLVRRGWQARAAAPPAPVKTQTALSPGPAATYCQSCPWALAPLPAAALLPWNRGCFPGDKSSSWPGVLWVPPWRAVRSSREVECSCAGAAEIKQSATNCYARNQHQNNSILIAERNQKTFNFISTPNCSKINKHFLAPNVKISK